MGGRRWTGVFPWDRGVPSDRGVPPWRDSMRPVRFYPIDARLLVLVVLWLFLPSWWTTAAVVLAVAALRVAEARGYRLHAALRAVRAPRCRKAPRAARPARAALRGFRVSMWVAGAAALALAAVVPAAQSDFLYVPPEGPAPSAIKADTSAGPGQVSEAAAHESGGPVAVGAKAAGPGRGLWRGRSGEMLREVLRRWGARAGVEVLVLTDRRYRLHEGRRFEGSFAEASDALFAALAHLPHPPVGTLRAGGRTLAVLHQVSLHQASPHQASLHRARRAGEGQ